MCLLLAVRLDNKIAASPGGLLRAQDFLELIRFSETDHDTHWQISVKQGVCVSR